MSATTITGLGNSGTGALSSVECAAALLAVRVLGAWGSDEALSIARGAGSGGGSGSWRCSSWGTGGGRGEGDPVKLGNKLGSLLDGRVTEVAVDGSSNAVREVEGCGDVAVGLGRSETATTITGLGDSGAGAFSSVECAASLLTIRIDSAWGCDETISTAEGRGLNADGEDGDNGADKGSGELHCWD